jgi:hypothetical protein
VNNNGHADEARLRVTLSTAGVAGYKQGSLGNEVTIERIISKKSYVVRHHCKTAVCSHCHVHTATMSFVSS